MCPILASIATVGTSQANYVTVGKIITVEQGKTETVIPGDVTLEAYTPYAKDGGGTVQISTTGTMNAPLYVREGTVIVDNKAVLSLNPAKKDFTGGCTVLNIAGKNAEMIVDQAEVKGVPEYSICVGGPDGNGSLVLKNGAKMTSQVSMFVGYSGYLNAEADSIGFINGHATTQGVGQETTLENRYAGAYTAAANGHDTIFGYGSVVLEGGSTLNTGYTGFFMGEGSLRITENSSMITGLKGWSQSILGRQNHSTSEVEISGGSSWTINGSSLQVCAGDHSRVDMDITGEGSSLSAATIYFADNNGMTGKATLDVTDGATVHATETIIGAASAHADVKIYIDAKSSYVASAISVNKGGLIRNEGAIKMTEGATNTLLNITADGVVENSGILELDITVEGGTYIGTSGEFSGSVFTMLDGAVVEGLTMTTGTVNISGEVSLTNVTFGTEAVALYSLMTLSGESDALTLNISDGAIINADELVINDSATINMVLSSDNTDNTGSITITGTDEAKVAALKEQLGAMNVVDSTGSAVGGGSVSITTAVVPEPTTTTLSLLALAGLAMRRRRK